jgi:hypothetical protein
MSQPARSPTIRAGHAGKAGRPPLSAAGEASTWLPRTPPDPTNQVNCPPAKRRSSRDRGRHAHRRPHPRPSDDPGGLAQARGPMAGSRPTRRTPNRRIDHPDHRLSGATYLMECPRPTHHRPARPLDPALPHQPLPQRLSTTQRGRDGTRKGRPRERRRLVVAARATSVREGRSTREDAGRPAGTKLPAGRPLIQAP